MKFRYKDMRVRYTFMLALASCTLLNILLIALSHVQQNPLLPTELIHGQQQSIHLFLEPYALIAFLCIIPITIALNALRYRVEFTEQAVCLDGKMIPYDQIKKVEYSYEKFQFTVFYGNVSIRSALMGLRESDADIETFRLAARELAAQVNLYNPKAKVHTPVAFATPGTKVYDRMNERILLEKGRIRGVGGWLIWLAIQLAVILLAQVTGVVDGVRTVMTIGEISASTAIVIVNLLVSVATAVLDVALFIQLLRRQPRFLLWFPRFLMFQLVTVRAVSLLQYTFAAAKWPDVFSLCNTFIVGLAAGILWFFAFKAYFARSIRVKNTFGV